MANKTQFLSRVIMLACLLALCVMISGGQLVNLQLVNGEDYVKRAASNLTTTSTVSASRGEILDRYGRPMVTNTTAFSLVLVYSAWEKEGQYERLLDLANRVKEDEGTLCDALPISDEAPFSIIGDSDDNDVIAFKKYMEDSKNTLSERIKEGENITTGENAKPEDFLTLMSRYLGLPDTFSQNDIRTVVGIYYSMRQVNFSLQVNFTLAENISIDLISYIKEHHQQYKGVEVSSEAVRQYDTDLAAHILGTVGPMWKEEWESTENGGPYKDKPGYGLNDTVGKTGLELALEPYLHGTAGSQTVDIDLGGDSISSHTSSYAPQPGNNVVTTIDLDLQKTAEDSLAENVAGYGKGGAAVVLNVHTGEILAMASYPTYDIANFNKNYDEIKQDSRSPQNNRATSGIYPPGSTFKVLTSIAALEEGVIDASTYFTCDGVFKLGGTTFKCSNHERPLSLDVTQAIKYSCNVYFYNVGYKLTGAKLEEWCKKFGLGQSTGIEIGEDFGHAAGPTYRALQKENDPTQRDWLSGDDVNAAIGQSDNGFTPLQLANYISAVVNGGTLYKPTLVRSIKSYDYNNVIEEPEPEVLSHIDMSQNTLDLVMTGMSEVTEEGGTAGRIFSNYSIKVGGKTGSAEMFENGVPYTNGLFVAFAPFDDPEIALCVVGENAGHGASVAPVVRDILDTYFEEDDSDKAAHVQAENVMIP